MERERTIGCELNRSYPLRPMDLRVCVRALTRIKNSRRSIDTDSFPLNSRAKENKGTMKGTIKIYF